MQILILKEKHGDRYIAVPPGRENEVILSIIRSRDKEGWYEDTDDRERKLLNMALEGNLKAAARFFQLCQNREYEAWEFDTPEEVI